MPFSEKETCRFATGEAGSRTLSRFGVEDEQIYLVIRGETVTQIKTPPSGGVFICFVIVIFSKLLSAYCRYCVSGFLKN